MRLSKGRLFCLFAALQVLITLNFNNYGQCGVYQKPVSTQAFPQTRLYLDRSADMTGDGIPDLLFSGLAVSGPGTTASSRSRIVIVPNNGNGTFGTPTVIDPPPQAYFTDFNLAADVNNDSRPDLITYLDSNPSGTALIVYLQNANGTFTQQISLPSEMGRPVGFFDANNDGFRDYLGFGFSSGRSFLSFGHGNGTFDAPVELTPFGGILRRADFNGDGKIDFINSRFILINQGNGTFAQNALELESGEVFNTVADFNGDGKTDLLISSLLSSPAKFWILTSKGATFVRTEYLVSNAPNSNSSPYIGNYIGNAAPDILFMDMAARKTVVFTNDGAGNFTTQDLNYLFYLPNFNRGVLDDFDNDGKIDMVQAASYLDNPTLMLRDFTSVTFIKTVCDRVGQPSIVDFDGMGRTDYSYWDPGTGAWSYRTNRVNSAEETATVNWGLGSLGDIPTPGDFDGDGITDKAVFRNSTGDWHILKSSDQNWISMHFGLPGDKPVAADYDGDGISDIAVWRPSDGNWYIWYMGTQQFSAVHWGMDGDQPVRADFDGDRKTDVAVFRPSTGDWYYLKSTDGNFVGLHWGQNADKPFPADYDGDGRADVAVYRDPDHTLYILRSFNSAFAAVTSGVSGDVVQIGDYDGDYVADLGLYRPASRLWLTSGSGSVVFGGTGVTPTSSILGIE
jgi:FG-GAP-like repeat